MNFENYEIFLESVNKDLEKIFEHQKEYLCCKEGCSKCCERGNYPLSELEFNYLLSGYKILDIEKQNIIKNNIKNLKNENRDSYVCPFLIDKKCSVYNYRPFVCRAFGVLTEDANSNPVFPFCASEGLNYSKIYDVKTSHLSFELVQKNNFKNFPKFFRLSNEVFMNLPLAKKLNINFGKVKELIDFL